jgi:Trk-type K+ transport system membrane component
MLDAIILAVLGVLLILEPRRIETFFHFNELPTIVSYLIGLWGCVLLSLAAAYALVSRDPIHHRLWIDIGIVRALIEAIFGAVSMARGTVDFSQAGFGTILAAALAFGYILLYPRASGLVEIAREPSKPV